MPGSRRIEPHRANNRAGLTVAAVLAAAIAPVAASRPAASQHAPAATGGEIAPRGQREVKDVSYGDWKKLCFKPGGAKMICRTSIAGTFPTGQMAVRVDIVEREGDATARLQVFCPVGMYLPKPVMLTIDQGRSRSVPYAWCMTNACIAGTAADPQMVEEMASGQTLQLDFMDSSLLTLTTSLPLGSFAAVHGGAPAQTFEQDIDE